MKKHTQANTNKTRPTYFMVFDRSTCRNLAVVEAADKGEAILRGSMVTHLMNRPPQDESHLDAMRVRYNGYAVCLPTFLSGYFKALETVIQELQH